MIEYMHKLKKKLCKELEEYAEKNSLSGGDVEMLQRLTDTVKNIDKIEMLEGEEESYSETGMRGRGFGGSSYDDDMMYSERRGRGRKARRDRMGRYSSDDGMAYDDYSEDGSYRGSSYERGGQGGRGYSRNDAKDHMMNKLGTMMEGADPNEREILKDCMRKLEKA